MAQAQEPLRPVSSTFHDHILRSTLPRFPIARASGLSSTYFSPVFFHIIIASKLNLTLRVNTHTQAIVVTLQD